MAFPMSTWPVHVDMGPTHEFRADITTYAPNICCRPCQLGAACPDMAFPPAQSGSSQLEMGGPVPLVSPRRWWMPTRPSSESATRSTRRSRRHCTLETSARASDPTRWASQGMRCSGPTRDGSSSRNRGDTIGNSVKHARALRLTNQLRPSTARPGARSGAPHRTRGDPHLRQLSPQRFPSRATPSTDTRAPPNRPAARRTVS